MKLYLMLGTLMMKAASKREQCQIVFEHCRARAGSTEGHYNKIADEINDVARMQIKEVLAVGKYKQAVTLKAAIKRVKCEHVQTFPSVSSLDQRSVSNCCSPWLITL